MKNKAITVVLTGLGFIMSTLPTLAHAQMYQPQMSDQRAQVQYILDLVQSLPSDTNDQLTQKIQLLQQALQLQLQVNQASGAYTTTSYNNQYANNYGMMYGTGIPVMNATASMIGNTTAPYLSMLAPSAGLAGLRVNFQGNNIAVNDQIQILPPQTLGMSSQYLSAGAVDPGIGFIFPTTLNYSSSNCTSIGQNGCNIPVASGSYGIRILGPDGTPSNTVYYQVSVPQNVWGAPVTPVSLTASVVSPTSIMLNWTTTNAGGLYRVSEVFPNNQMSTLSTTPNSMFQAVNLTPGSTHTYVVYTCVDSDCSQRSVPSTPVVVITPQSSYGYNKYNGYNYYTNSTYPYSYNYSINTTGTTIANVATGQATAVLATSATLNGSVSLSSAGNDTVWTWFEYGTDLNNLNTTVHTNRVSNVFQSGSVPVSAPVTYLQPNTAYQYRLVAQSSTAAPVYGPTLTFYTPSGY